MSLARRAVARRVASLLVPLAVMLAPTPAGAQSVKPWMPPSADSLEVWAAQARALFQMQTRDSIDDVTFEPYRLVGKMARTLLRSLGRDNLPQAYAIEPVLDSLRLETAVRVDPVLPYFALVSVRNPYRLSAYAVAFVYWYRGNELREQGVTVLHGRDPSLRVWRYPRTERPYSLGIIDRGPDGALSWLLLGLSTQGTFWKIVQFVDRTGGESGSQGAFNDVNGDGLPELVVWSRVRLDSLFRSCSDCPTPFDEATYVERADGFQLFDSRLMPSPIANFSLFVRLLGQNNRAAAARLLADPRRIDEALALGWAARHGAGTWSIEYGEPSEQWPRWLAIRFHDSKNQLYIFHFALKEGRWVIQDWVPVRASAAPADSSRTSR